MNTALEKLIQERYGSNTKLARELHVAWKRVNPKVARKVAITSLATQIGRLVQGRATWWKNRSDASSELAQLLDVEVEDLFPAGQQLAVGEGLPFSEFPMLRPLALHEVPFAVDDHRWLVSLIATEMNQRRWIVAPAGAGKSLVVRWLASRAELRDGVVAQSVRTLSMSIEIADPVRPLVVEVEQADPRTDREALRLLGLRMQATTVMASFALPLPHDLRRKPHALGTRPGPHPSDSGNLDEHATWQELQWRRAADWRWRFLFWIQERLEDTARDHLFDAKEVAAWLEEHDPDEALVRTPGEVLALSSTAFVRGLPKERSLATVAEHFHERLVAGTSANSEASRRFWRHFGERVWERINIARWENVDDRLEELDEEAWERLIPAELTPPRTISDVQAPLMEIAAARGIRARKQKAEEVAPGLLVPSRAQVVAILKEDGVLRGGDDGGFMLFPRFATDGAMRAHANQVIRGRGTDWGIWAADKVRSVAVDEVLNSLSANELRDEVRRCVRTFDKTTLSSVAMVEALFAASARRLVDDPKLATGRIEDFQRLGIAQADLLFDPWDDPAHPFRVPRTRYREDGRVHEQWYRDGWAFTLRIPRPAKFSRPDLEWRFPGWMVSLSLERLPRDLPSTYWEGNSMLHVVPPEVVTLAALACEIVSRCSDATLPDELRERLLLPAVVLAAPEKGWSIRGRHVRALGRAWDANFLAGAIGQLSAEERDPVIRALWPACLEVRGDRPPNQPEEPADLILRLAWLLWDVPGLFQVVTENVPLELVEQAVRAFGVSSSTHTEAALHVFPALPERLRTFALRTWANPYDERKPNFAEVRQMLELIGIDDVELLLELAGQADRSTTSEYAQLVWKHDPARALGEARRALRSGWKTAQSWCWSSGEATNGDILEELEALESPPRWARRWALNRLSSGGQLTVRLYALLSRIVDRP